MVATALNVLLFTASLIVAGHVALAEVDTIYDRAAKADSLKQDNWRATIRDEKHPTWGYRSPFGIQLHPSCFKLAEQRGKKTNDVARSFEAYFRQEAAAKHLE